MNFSKINKDRWKDYGYLKLEVPVSFTMPDHDVLFANVASQEVYYEKIF